jgi:tetratricopeptide (TPR) repeat protein
VPHQAGSGPIRQPAPAADSGPDPAILERLLLAQSPADVLAEILANPPAELRRAAVVALGWKGVAAHSSLLRRLLQHPEPGLAELAENSLWRIWMQGGSTRGNAELARAIDLIGADRCQEALAALDSLIATEPAFAEAHHQRGICLFLLDRPADAAFAFRRAVELNPDHFPALVNLGHAALQQGEVHTAVHCYQRALQLNPRLTTVRDMVQKLEPIIGGNGKVPT